MALGCGLLLALTLGNPHGRATARAAKILLQASVVLLGFGLHLEELGRAGIAGAAFAVATIVVTLLLGMALGRVMGISAGTRVLLSSGTAICGGSAIAAVGATIRARDEEMAAAMGVVFVLNAVALYLFPPLGHWLGMSNEAFATWAAIAIHDTSSVVGAATAFDPACLEMATAIKLARAVWIAPLALFWGWWWRRHHAGESSAPPRTTFGQVMPWFIVAFLLASLLATFAEPVRTVAPWLKLAATAGLKLTLFLIGAGLTRELLRSLGWKPMALGVILWIAIAGMGLVGVRTFFGE